MVICDFCRINILESGKSWDFHQDSHEHLKKAAEERCVFCSILEQDVDDFRKTSSVDASHWPLHRWSVRRPGWIRETTQSVLVTFRPMPRRSGVQDRKAKGDNGTHLRLPSQQMLPERRFYLFPEKGLGHISTEQELGKSTHPEFSGGRIKKWVQHCTKNHERCKQRRGGSEFVPKRLLVIPAKNQTRVRVVETKPNGIVGPYVTLSHCWGRATFETLTPQNEKEFGGEEGVTLARLSKNFQEAIEVARFLDIDYMWIDSLCIIQGADGDFNVEGDLMDKVYRNSFCNIAAADARDSRGGLFRDREADQILSTRYVGDGKSARFGNEAWRIIPEDVWDTQLLQTPLYSRAWVFQERMLAPRILHFTKHQIFWDCASLSACETIPSGLPQPLDEEAETDRHWRLRLQTSESLRHRPLYGSADNSLEHFWKASVRKYTSCDLTMPGDKLKAIWGIAKLVRNALQEEYGAGLWEGYLEEQLAWRVVECTLDERPPELSHNPSWSWASMSGAIEVQPRIGVVERHYVVRDHDGSPISFRLIGDERPALPHRQSEDIAKWKRKPRQQQQQKSNPRTKTTEEQQQHTTTPPTRTNTTGTKIDRDRHPELASNSIAMQGHIGRARVRHNKLKNKWLLEMPELSSSSFPSSSEHGTLEVFPDTKPKLSDYSENCLFVVLAADKKVLAQDDRCNNKTCFVGGGGRDSQTQPVDDDDDDDDDDEQQEEGNLFFRYRYSGVGLTLKPAAAATGSSDRRRHFYRTGALHFRDVGEEMWARLMGMASTGTGTTGTGGSREEGEDDGSLSGEYDRVKGLKFWLD